MLLSAVLRLLSRNAGIKKIVHRPKNVKIKMEFPVQPVVELSGLNASTVRHAEWMARLSTARAASLTVSDRVGWL